MTWEEKFQIVKEFITRLDELPSGDRAVLKRNSGNTLESADGNALSVFYRILPREVFHKEENIWFMIATLRFINRYKLDDKQNCFGWTMRQARVSKSLDKRVMALLDCRITFGEESLVHHLRQMVRLADSRSVPIDWAQLLLDLLQWNRDDRYVQKKWARAYFSGEEITIKPENKEE